MQGLGRHRAVSPSAPMPITLDMCAVGWEPVWRTTSGAVVNDVTLFYGPPQADGAPAPGGTPTTPPASPGTGAATTAPKPAGRPDSAQERAGMILDLHSEPRWGMAEVLIHLDPVGPNERAALLGLLCGDRVHLVDMPQPAPEWSPVRVVEGWAHTLDTTLAPWSSACPTRSHSYAGITWGPSHPRDHTAAALAGRAPRRGVGSMRPPCQPFNL